MIQVNLIPDVKNELLRAQRLRNLIIFVSIVASIAAVGVILVMLSIMGTQSILNGLKQNEIKKEFAELNSIPNVNETIILQSQLSEISKIRNSSQNTSRILNTIIKGIRKDEGSAVQFSSIQYDPTTYKITLEGQTTNAISDGFVAVETLQKTIRDTRIIYKTKNADVCSVQDAEESKNDCMIGDLAQDKEVRVLEHSKGENENGESVVRFKVEFNLNKESLRFANKYFGIKTPNNREVTDSKTTIPDDIFAAKQKDGDK